MELIRKMRDLWAAVPPNVCSLITWHRGRVRWEMTAQNLGQHIPESAWASDDLERRSRYQQGQWSLHVRTVKVRHGDWKLDSPKPTGQNKKAPLSSESTPQKDIIEGNLILKRKTKACPLEIQLPFPSSRRAVN